MSDEITPEFLLTKALMPPEGLMDYRLVAAGQPADTRGMRLLEDLLRTNPGQFRREWREEEKSYRLSMAALEKARQGGPAPSSPDAPTVADEGSERAGELIQKLIDEAKRRAGL